MNIKIEEIKKIPVGISTCLLGHEVRFDGGHKKSNICANQLVDVFEYEMVCPEMAIGMPSPRPSIHIVNVSQDGDASLRLLQTNDHSIDYTEAMQSFAAEKVSQLSHLCGYIVARNSPSCGMERLKVFGDGGNTASRDGVGFFTAELMRQYPWLPVEEDGRLNDDLIRDNFLTRVYIVQALRELKQDLTYHNLYEFHGCVKLMLMGHNQAVYKELGAFLAKAGQNKDDINKVYEKYFYTLATALKKTLTRKNHVNVLMHIAGYFRKQSTDSERKALTQSIAHYSKELEPLGSPLALIRLYLEKYPNEYLAKQFYLNPYPTQLSNRCFL